MVRRGQRDSYDVFRTDYISLRSGDSPDYLLGMKEKRMIPNDDGTVHLC